MCTKIFIHTHALSLFSTIINTPLKRIFAVRSRILLGRLSHRSRFCESAPLVKRNGCANFPIFILRFATDARRRSALILENFPKALPDGKPALRKSGKCEYLSGKSEIFPRARSRAPYRLIVNTGNCLCVKPYLC